MANGLPVSRLIKVGVNLTPSAAQGQNISSLLILGSSTVIDPIERMRSYGSLDAVAADFGTTAPEYLAANLWFSQTPQPTDLKVGRWVQTASNGGLKCAVLPASAQAIATWQAVTAGSFRYTKDGGALTAVTGLNFSGAANLNAVAGIIQAAITGVTVVWNATYQRFEFTSNTTGATSSFGFVQAPTTGADVAALLRGRSTDSGAYVFAGQAAETAIAAVTEFDSRFGQSWYALHLASTAAVNADHLAIAAYVEGSNTKHVYAVTTQEAGVLVATDTANIAYQLKALRYKKTFVQYSSSSAYAAVSALARILTTDYTANNTTITLMFKGEPGVAAESLNTTQADALKAVNCNVFVGYNNDTAILQYGVMASGDYADTVLGTDALAIDLQTELYNLMYTSVTKIPQTDAGMNILVGKCNQVCERFVGNGLLAGGVWNSGGFGSLKQGDFLAPGYYVYAGRMANQSAADRAARKSTTIQIAAKLAGAIHEVIVGVVVNQ